MMTRSKRKERRASSEAILHSDKGDIEKEAIKIGDENRN